MDDRRLAGLVRAGDPSAFEVLYDRHHLALLAFCRHMLGNREDGEDALQQTFLRAHRALRTSPPPDALRSWLFAIARNRCLTLLAARREAAAPIEEVEIGYDGLAEEVGRRADLRELVEGLATLPDDQRAALVLAELGDLSHADIAVAIGCPATKVKALIFQARTTLISDREARSTACETIREQLAVARGGVLRRGPLRRHLRQCQPCTAFNVAIAGQRAGLGAVLPVVPSLGLKAAILAAVGVSGGAEAAAAAAGGAAAAGAAGGAGQAGAGASGGMLAGGGGLAAKTLAAKVAIVAIGATAGVGGGAAVIKAGAAHRVAQVAEVRAAAPSHTPAARPSAATTATGGSAAGAAAVTTATTRPQGRRARRITRRRAVRRARRAVIRRRALRRAAGLATLTPQQQQQRRRQRLRAQRRRERRAATQPPPSATPAPTPTPTATPVPRRPRRPRPVPTVQSPRLPAATPRPHRPRPRPVATPVPAGTPAPVPTP